MKNGAANVPVRRSYRTWRAFTLIELVVVIMLLVLMGGVALPAYYDMQAKAQESAIKGSLGGVRAGIGQFLINEVVNGNPPLYPTLAELTTPGTVMLDLLPEHPIKASSLVGAATPAQAATRSTGGPHGWRYYVDNAANPPEYVFYSNSNALGSNDW